MDSQESGIPGSPPPPEPERVRGVVLRFTYHNPENDYRVVKLEPSDPVDPSRLDARREVVLVGNFPGLDVGEAIEAGGRWMVHAKHGPQFKADWFKPVLPTGERGVAAYLGSGVLKGVGPVLAERIVKRFGGETLAVLASEPARLADVKGISRRRAAEIGKAWTGARGDRELVIFLGDHGISPAWAGRLRKTYGDTALSVVRANPYRLAADVRGVGFHRADAMARAIGIAPDSPERIESALAHVLETAAGEGHTCQLRESLLSNSARLLKLEETLVEPVLDRMVSTRKLTLEEMRGAPWVFLNPLHQAETLCARHLKRLLAAPRRLPQGNPESILEAFEAKSRFRLAPAQREAVLAIAREGIMILTGGPGTGKTTTLRAVIDLFRTGGREVRLAAPTGRAARRLAETAKMTAETLHRLLGFQAHTGGFLHDEAEPVQADLVVVDEASMLDAALASQLFRALRSGTCLLLVGDEDQLPSVGPGSVLRDVAASGLVRVSRLREIFRQARSSLIVLNAHRVNQGEFPIVDPPPDMEKPDFFFIERDEPAGVLEAIKTLVAERIPRRYGMNPIQDIQVLTPMRRGELGVQTINRELQALLNRDGEEAEAVLPSNDFLEAKDGEPQRFRPGDRVMQTANDYEKEVFNGDIGRISSVNAETGEINVDFDGRPASYLADEARSLTLAYAVTIHKSQGSEYRAVVIPLHTQHYVMLKRNLLYTALTRARELVCVVGKKQAMWRAVRDNTLVERASGLGWFLGRRDAAASGGE